MNERRVSLGARSRLARWHRPIRYVSLFSGIEAVSVAWRCLGWQTVAFAEVDPFCRELLNYWFPSVPNIGDVRRIDWSDYVGAVDLVVGGSPCQSFSVAGKREGLKGESGLMFEYIRAVRELRPAYFVWENVPGALSSEKGAAFGQLLREMDDLGYGMAWRVLDAQFFGVPQRRRRVFLVGCLRDRNAPAEILFESESIEWDLPSSKDKRQELADAARGRDGGADGVDVEGRASEEGCIAFCGGASSTAGSIGAARELSPTIRAGASGTNQTPTVCMAVIPENAISRARGGTNGPMAYGPHDPCPTLRASQSVPAVCMASGQANAEMGHDLCPSMTARQHKDPPIVVDRAWEDQGPDALSFAQNTRDEVRLVGGDGSLAGALCASPGVKQQSYVMQRLESVADRVWSWPWIVRRLTPLECERLQGFPDGWTQIAYRGKPADRCPDAPRYRAIGNSMAVPVMRWIGSRVETALMRR